MTPAGSVDEFHPEASDTEVEADETQSSPEIPDLSAVPGSKLQKLAENVVAAIEGYDGVIYHPIYRSLQIRPDKYFDFNNGVVRHTRNKHSVEVKRGTDASIRMLTAVLLRGFGYEVWRAGSGWLLDEGDLDEGEARFVYEKRKDSTPDARFYPILSSLWRQMRNIMFKVRPPARRGRLTSTATALLTDGEDSYLDDADTSRAPSPHTRARGTATKKIESLAAQVAKRLPTPMSRMSADQTEEAIVELIARLAEIRQNSDPNAFEELWQAHIMRVDELEDEGVAEEEKNIASTAQTGTSTSNEPFNTVGVPTTHSFASSLLLPPTLPSLMSIYISVAKMLSPATHSVAAPLARSYHWPSAPVENHSFVKFFTGVIFRLDVAPSSILG